VTSYDKDYDLLAISGNDYINVIIASFNSSNGYLTITDKRDTENHVDSDWNAILNQVHYKLNIDLDHPNACSSYVDGGYTRSFGLKMIDRYGRVSNSVFRDINIETSVLMFTDADPLRVNDADGQYSITIDSYDGFFPGSKSNFTFYSDESSTSVLYTDDT
jgi:hypothetical protein